MTMTDNKNRTFKIIGIYNDTAFSGFGVIDINDERIEYINLYSKKKSCKKIYWNKVGEPYFIYNHSRLYLNEIVRI